MKSYDLAPVPVLRLWYNVFLSRKGPLLEEVKARTKERNASGATLTLAFLLSPGGPCSPLDLGGGAGV